MRCAPTVRDEVLNVAVVTPLLVDRGAVPRTVAPSAKVTVPSGGATSVLPGSATLIVAVKVTGWPTSAAVSDEVSAVAVAAGKTGQTTGGPDVLGAKAPLPLLPL